MVSTFHEPIVCAREHAHTHHSSSMWRPTISCRFVHKKWNATCKQENVNKLMLHCAVRVLWQLFEVNLLIASLSLWSFSDRRLATAQHRKNKTEIFIQDNWWSTQICVYIAIMSLLNLRYATQHIVSFQCLGLWKELCSWMNSTLLFLGDSLFFRVWKFEIKCSV